MSQIDRYVEAVRKNLPRAQRDDIAAELRGILQTQVEDEEALKERPLSVEEVSRILKKYGHPRAVAGRYGGRQYLIGPETFPSYVAAVKLVLWILAPIAAFMVLITILTAGDKLLERLAETLWTALGIGLFNLAITTLVFARIGRTGSADDGVSDWDPADLWDLENLPGLLDPQEPVRRSDAVGALLGMVFLLAWWLGLNAALWRWFGFTPLPFEWTGAWSRVSSIAVPVIVASIGREIFGLLRPYRIRLYVGIGIMLDLVALPVLLSLLRAGTYVAAAGVVGPSTLLTRLFDKAIFAILLVMTVGVAIGVALGVRKFIRLSDTRNVSKLNIEVR